MTTGIGGDTNVTMPTEAPPQPEPQPVPPPPPRGKTLIQVFRDEDKPKTGRHIEVTATENLGSKDTP